ncbi:MAG: family 20 glycosylhydrolase [Bacteroidota bacterium]
MKTFICIALLVVATACTQNKPFDASKLGVEWQFGKNNYDGKGNFLASLTLTGEEEIPVSGWQIFFNLRYHRYDLKSNTNGVEISHVNGELFVITPTADFKPAKSFTMEFTGARRVANFQDVPSGFFYVGDDDKAVALTRNIIKPTDLDLPVASNDEVVNSGGSIMILPTPIEYGEVKGNFSIDRQTTITSDFKNEATYLANEIEKLTGYKPAIGSNGSIKISKTNGPPESYTLSITSENITISAADAAGAFYAIQSLKQLLPPDSWSKKNETLTIENIFIKDQPRFPVREFMLDVGRNFESKKNILRLLEVMSLYKLNTFHFHFNDDEGWRLEIPDLPELTDIGAARGYPYESNERLQPAYGSGATEENHFGTGYYSRADFIEILKYATERHITVIPEIESPGHARAAIKAMNARYNRLMKDGKKEEAEQYLLYDVNDESVYIGPQGFTDNAMNPVLPSTFAFIDKVITEIQKMYEEAGVPLHLVHMGGDEVAEGAWTKSPAIDAYMKEHPAIKTPKDLYANFFVKTTDMLEKHGLTITGWEEMIIGDPHLEATARQVIDNKKYRDSNLQFDAWWDIQGKQDMCYSIANAGYGVVLTPFDYFYFDLAQAPGFDEPGDAWIGYLNVKQTFSFVPFDMYSNPMLDYQLKPMDPNIFKDKPWLTTQGRKNIRGIQGALWAENMTFDGYMEYQVLPRLLALAERAWAPDPKWSDETGDARKKDFDADWSSFYNRLMERELPRLDHYNGGYKYRPL